jgi:hypothetical protein
VFEAFFQVRDASIAHGYFDAPGKAREGLLLFLSGAGIWPMQAKPPIAGGGISGVVVI